MIKQFIKYYKPYKKLFFMDLLAALLFAICNLIYPMITRNIMNEVVPNKDLRMLVVFALALLLYCIVLYIDAFVFLMNYNILFIISWFYFLCNILSQDFLF